MMETLAYLYVLGGMGAAVGSALIVDAVRFRRPSRNVTVYVDRQLWNAYNGEDASYWVTQGDARR